MAGDVYVRELFEIEQGNLQTCDKFVFSRSSGCSEPCWK